MRIKLNILPHGECAQIFVYADPHDESFLNWRVFKIWHNNKSGSMTPVFSQDNYINDYYVVFSSKVPFKWFCERFWDSPYAKPENYRFLTHNCSNAAVYAFQLAEINIPVPRLTLMRVYPLPIAIPGPFLSPLDLSIAAKTLRCNCYKIPLLLSKKLILNLS
ncbi:hypothetical protein [Legionella clemsonensis]|uniref:DUF4105 domain-containing protein n=1 Tax=Legionella clemsonensis TaxID=1867846 RepID=A0A222P4D3_9GAMM|nr:hypothetical protein [Legionella clemsonensis]ASQ46683.1 hypothetical protein clem_10685 [Legionella clemsonensis]